MTHTASYSTFALHISVAGALMKRLAIRLLAGTTILCSAPNASAKDWFDFDKAEAIKRLKQTVERLEVILPIPTADWTCGKPTNLRYCSTDIGKGLKLEIIETVKGTELHDFQSFMDGKTSAVYEIAATVQMNSADVVLGAFDDLCMAIIISFRPEKTRNRARQLYTTGLRRAMNQTADRALGQHVAKGNPATFVLEVGRRDFIRCAVSAEDDYRL